jgi:hypothetical protein
MPALVVSSRKTYKARAGSAQSRRSSLDRHASRANRARTTRIGRGTAVLSGQRNCRAGTARSRAHALFAQRPDRCRLHVDVPDTYATSISRPELARVASCFRDLLSEFEIACPARAVTICGPLGCRPTGPRDGSSDGLGVHRTQYLVGRTVPGHVDAVDADPADVSSGPRPANPGRRSETQTRPSGSQAQLHGLGERPRGGGRPA